MPRALVVTDARPSNTGVDVLYDGVVRPAEEAGVPGREAARRDFHEVLDQFPCGVTLESVGVSLYLAGKQASDAWLLTVLGQQVKAAGNSAIGANLRARHSGRLGAGEEGRGGEEDSGELGHCGGVGTNRALKA